MTSSVINQLQALAMREAALERQLDSVRTGASVSELDVALEASIPPELRRTDLPATWAVGHVVVFLRSLFAQHPGYRWRQGVGGRTDPTSDLFIESEFGTLQDLFNQSKPILYVTGGPTSSSDVTIGNLKHFDFLTDTRTYTTLEPGSMQVIVYHTNAAAALDLANFVKRAIQVHTPELMHRGFAQVQNINAGSVERNSRFAQNVASTAHAVVQVTFTFFYQATWRTQMRPGVCDNFADLLLASPDPEDPLQIDDRTLAVVVSTHLPGSSEEDLP